MTVDLVAAKLTHIGPIAHRMRQADRLECWAMGRSPKESLRVGLRTSHLCWTALKDGFPIAMMGVYAVSMAEGRGTVWLLGTDEVYRQGRALLRLGPVVFGAMLTEFKLLENLVAASNVRAIRLLRRWGFTVGDEVYTYRGVDFRPFRIERPAIQMAEARPALDSRRAA